MHRPATETAEAMALDILDNDIDHGHRLAWPQAVEHRLALSLGEFVIEQPRQRIVGGCR